MGEVLRPELQFPFRKAPIGLQGCQHHRLCQSVRLDIGLGLLRECFLSRPWQTPHPFSVILVSLLWLHNAAINATLVTAACDGDAGKCYGEQRARLICLFCTMATTNAESVAKNFAVFILTSFC